MSNDGTSIGINTTQDIVNMNMHGKNNQTFPRSTYHARMDENVSK